MKPEGNCTLTLEDGTIMHGFSFGATRPVFGELVFNTGMTGYQEALTDPSYRGQILMMTYPLIGNYGVDLEHCESPLVQVRGYVVREWCRTPSHRDSTRNIHDFLLENDIPAIEEVDTRFLTKKTRTRGTMRAKIVPWNDGEPPNTDPILKEIQNTPFPDASNLVGDVSCSTPVKYPGPDANSPTIVAIDCGIKASIIRNLVGFAEVVQVPYNFPVDEIKSMNPHGILVSNGPGDPAHDDIMETTTMTVSELISEYPLMGICLGHQILCLAVRGKTYKLKFGHRGANQPVKNLESGKVYITSQNHGFAVDADSLPSEVKVWEINVNDRTVEGLIHEELPVFSVQYHPEANPGPLDARPLFERFIEEVRRAKHA
jgi:carbamoyl-phosphate synthase small subunit